MLKSALVFWKKFKYCYFFIDEENKKVNEIKLFNNEMLKDEDVNFFATKKDLSKINRLLNWSNFILSVISYYGAVNIRNW